MGTTIFGGRGQLTTSTTRFQCVCVRVCVLNDVRGKERKTGRLAKRLSESRRVVHRMRAKAEIRKNREREKKIEVEFACLCENVCMCIL